MVPICAYVLDDTFLLYVFDRGIGNSNRFIKVLQPLSMAGGCHLAVDGIRVGHLIRNFKLADETGSCVCMCRARERAREKRKSTRISFLLCFPLAPITRGPGGGDDLFFSPSPFSSLSSFTFCPFSHLHLQGNKKASECPTCPDRCPAGGDGRRLCWNNDDCQKGSFLTFIFYKFIDFLLQNGFLPKRNRLVSRRPKTVGWVCLLFVFFALDKKGKKKRQN